MSETVLYKDHPAMFRNRPVLFLFFCALVPFGIGLVALLAWWLHCQATSLVITESRVTLRRGLLSKDTNDVLIADIRNVQVRQSLLQRIFGVGAVAVSTSGQGDMEIEGHGVPGPERIKAILNDRRSDPRTVIPSGANGPVSGSRGRQERGPRSSAGTRRPRAPRGERDR